MKHLQKSLLILLTVVCAVLLAFVGCGDPQTNSSAADKTLKKIAVTTMPTKLDYEIGDKISTEGMVVTAYYSDESTAIVTDKCTTSMDDAVVTDKTTSYYVKYQEGKTIKTAVVNINVNKIVVEDVMLDGADKLPEFTSPVKIAKASTADYVFVTSYDSTSMTIDGVMEFTGDMTKGTFKFTERNDRREDTEAADEANRFVKYAILEGKYEINGDDIKFTASKVTHHHTGHLSSATVQSGKLIKDGDKVVGIDCGSMGGGNKVFGWGKSAESAFVESIATKYGKPATNFVLSLVENGKLPSDVRFYHADVESIEVVTPATKTEYVAGEKFNAEGLSIKINYEAGKSEVITEGFLAGKYMETEGVKEYVALATDDASVPVEYTYFCYANTYATVSVNVPVTVMTAAADSFVSLTVTGAPSMLKYAYGDTVADALKGATLAATANYGDGSTKAITDYTIVEAANVITADLTKFTVSYTENGTTQVAECIVTAQIMNPFEIAQNSKADYVFLTYFTKQSNKLNGVLELFGNETSGTYRYSAQMGDNKYNVNSGNYTIAEGKINFTTAENGWTQVLGTSTMVTGDNETATVIVEDGEITALDFGAVSTEGFWGYTSTKEFSGIVTDLGLIDIADPRGYMVRIKNGDVSAYTAGWFYGKPAEGGEEEGETPATPTTPFAIAKASKVDYVFLTYFTKQTHKVNGVLELTGDLTSGAFVYTCRSLKSGTTDGLNILKGTYTIAEDKITFTVTEQTQLDWASLTPDMTETATLVKSGDKVTALDFGALTDGFWGYTSSKEYLGIVTDQAIEGVADPRGYMVLIENGDVSAYANGDYFAA